MDKLKVIAVVGPTASGKSSLGIWLAQKIGGLPRRQAGEVISADSRQVYRGLDIGTGKVTKKEMAGIPHHLLSVASPKRQFSADDFVKKGSRAINLIYQADHLPIVVGGTGLYVDVLLGRINHPNVPPNPALRARLAKKSPAELMELLRQKDPERAATIEPGHQRRIIRALEIAAALGKSPSKADAMSSAASKYDILWIGLNPGEQKLQANIKKRLKSRLQAGMIAEARRLHKQGLSYKRMQELGLEYRYLALLLQKKLDQKEFEVQLERAIRQYAKRQMRWFKRNKDIRWVASKTEALRLAKEFLMC